MSDDVFEWLTRLDKVKQLEAEAVDMMFRTAAVLIADLFFIVTFTDMLLDAAAGTLKKEQRMDCCHGLCNQCIGVVEHELHTLEPKCEYHT